MPEIETQQDMKWMKQTHPGLISSMVNHHIAILRKGPLEFCGELTVTLDAYISDAKTNVYLTNLDDF